MTYTISLTNKKLKIIIPNYINKIRLELVILGKVNTSVALNKMHTPVRQRSPVIKKMIEYRALYAMIIPSVIFFIIFAYLPIAGSFLLSVKDYKFNLGILRSPFNDDLFKYFKTFFAYYQTPQLIRNTIFLGILKTVIEFPFPIILALMINEVRSNKFKRITQTISYLPNFLSWVIVVTMMQRILAPENGILNQIIAMFGGDPSTFWLMDQNAFYPVIFFSDLWKNIGWNSIIFLAAIVGIDPELYDAARMDGANRWGEIWNVTLPSIRGTIGFLFILGIGGLVSSGFDQLFLLRTPGNMVYADTLDLYIINVGLSGGQYGYGAAVGLIQGIVALALVLGTNYLSKKYTEVGIW